MRQAARVDGNQPELVALWRKMGVSVAVTSMVGHGFPDVCLGFDTPQGRVCLLVEIKNGKKPLSAQKLTKDEQEFFEKWKGQYDIVRNEVDAINLVYKYRGMKC